MIEAGTAKDYEAFVYGQMRMYAHHVECMYGLPDASTTTAQYNQVFKTETQSAREHSESATAKRIVFACETLAFGEYTVRVWVRQK